MGDREEGTIDHFNGDRGFGFIDRGDGGDNIFFHISNLDEEFYVEEGKRVEFRTVPGDEGPEAVDLRSLEDDTSGYDGGAAVNRTGNLPLYRGADPDLRLDPDTHAGLVYDKFCDTWSDDQPGFGEPGNDDEWDAEGKWAWVGKFDGHRPGNAERIEVFTRRRRDLVDARDGVTLKFETTSRFVTGLGREHPVENGFAWHHTLGTPYLPGSSVKGMLRTWADEWRNADDPVIPKLFGDNTDDDYGVGELVIFNAIPTAPPTLTADVMTPHYQDWHQGGPDEAVPADWHSPNPIPFLVVDSGATFEFGLAPRSNTDLDLDRVTTWLEDALEWIGAGAKTAVGYGRFERTG
jgi:CRISPR-associated protein Cmr6